jgi:uncharacterized cupredoxin-like copper-binding protein
MPATIQDERSAREEHFNTTGRLEAELEELRRELKAKSTPNGAVQLAAFFAVLLAIAALLAVAFKLQSNDNASQAMHNQMRGNMPAGMASGVANGSAPGSTAGAVHTVSADLGDYWVRPDTTSVPAGKVEFVAHNVGQVPHELMIERMPIKMDAPGQPNEDAAQGMIDDMGPGQSGHMTINLKPGAYMLFCNVPGHYAMGQHTMFKVTG